MVSTAYLAADGYTDELIVELGERIREVHGRLVLTDAAPVDAAWAQNIWYEPQELAIVSINDAARKLRAMQRNWALYSTSQHRRAALIAEQLPRWRQRPLRFGAALPAAPLGSWTLLARDRLLAAPRCRSAFAHGALQFVENKLGPPSRAYLKLWEALTILGERPGPGQLCVDLGSSPGGWSWALAELGARVLSIDKAPLAPEVSTRDNVEFRKGSAFAFDPSVVGPIDWLCCDVVCYPARLLAATRRWLASGAVRRVICSVKFQGKTDHATCRDFAAIPGGALWHLWHNKHELTWIWRG